MSRDREQQRKQRSELARQLGVGRADVDERKDLKENERVSRPVLRLVSRTPKGWLRRLLQRDEALVLACYLVEGRGARLVQALVLDGERHELAKLTYRRPAHFVLLLLAAAEPAPLLAALATASVRLDDVDLASELLASAQWEVARRVRVDALPAVRVGAAVSIRGIGRSASRHEFPLENCVATIDVEI